MKWSKQYITWKQVIILISLWPIQAYLFLETMKSGHALFYCLGLLFVYHFFLYHHYWKVHKGEKLYWVNAITDYMGFIMIAFGAPFATIASCIYLDYFSVDTLQIIYNANNDYINYIYNSPFFKVPHNLLSLSDLKDAMIIYCFSLAGIFGYIGFFLAIPFWWPMGSSWQGLYAQRGYKRSLILAIVGFLISCLLIYSRIYEGNILYGTKYFKTVNDSGERIYIEKIAPGGLHIMTFAEAILGTLLSQIISGVTGYIQFLKINLVKKEKTHGQ